jgi:ADP-ribose pyrophosphatase
MTTANMKLVILDVQLDGEMESPDQNLEDGESIVRRAVEVKNLYRVLKGMYCSTRWRCRTRKFLDLIQ